LPSSRSHRYWLESCPDIPSISQLSAGGFIDESQGGDVSVQLTPASQIVVGLRSPDGGGRSMAGGGGIGGDDGNFGLSQLSQPSPQILQCEKRDETLEDIRSDLKRVSAIVHAQRPIALPVKSWDFVASASDLPGAYLVCGLESHVYFRTVFGDSSDKGGPWPQSKRVVVV
jgi:hypothetical protein